VYADNSFHSASLVMMIQLYQFKPDFNSALDNQMSCAGRPATFAHFCEPFGGSAAVPINRPPASAETYNDLDSEVVIFFECLRDHSDETIRAISLTPFSREEPVKACTSAGPDRERPRDGGHSPVRLPGDPILLRSSLSP